MSAHAQASYGRALLAAGLVAATTFKIVSAGPAPPANSSAQKARIVENYGMLPLNFQANTGQADKSVKFLSRGNGYGLYLTANGAALILCKTPSNGSQPDSREQLIPILEFAVCDEVQMQLAGASGKAEPVGQQQLPGTANYFIGSDPGNWRTSVPTYAKVRYKSVYPGIDLVYYGNQRQLEFDFVIAPGADPKFIRLQFGPKNKMRFSANGDLVVATANGTLAFHKPLAYQFVEGRRHFVDGNFALLGRQTVGFRLGRYDHAKALVIDPALAYSTFVGGTSNDTAKAIAVDAAGNAYVAGIAVSIDFPVTPGAFQTTNHAAGNQETNAFVAKLNPTGTALVYCTYLGGSADISSGDFAYGLAVDNSGNAYVTGSTVSTDFPVTPGAFQTTNKAAAGGNANTFVTKLNPTGTALVYSTYLGGSGLAADWPYAGDRGNAIVVDATGDAYVTGETLSSDFPVTPGAYQTTNHGAANSLANAFVAKLNPTGTALVYSTYLGGSGGRANTYEGDISSAIALDTAGEAFVTGQTFSSDFPVTTGAFQTTNKAVANQGTNAFVSKLNATGTALLYSTYLGGSGGDTGNAIVVNSAGNVYVAGGTSSSDFPATPGALQTTNHGAANGNARPTAFVTELNAAGTGLVYSTFLGGSGGAVNVSPTLFFGAGDQANGLAIDGAANVYVAGSTASTDFPVTQGAYEATNNDQPGCVGGCIGGYNAFITELNSTGSALVYSTYLGGNGINPNQSIGVIVFGDGDQANALALDTSGNVYVAGAAVSYDFPVTSGAFQTTNPSARSTFPGSGSPFVTKLNMSSTSTTTTPTVTVTPASPTITSALPLKVTISVAGPSGAAVPTGTVTLASGTYFSAATTLVNGSATIDIPEGSLGIDPGPGCGYPPSPDILSANYLPDAASSSTYNSASGLGAIDVVAPCVLVTPASATLTWAQSQSQTLSVAIAATGGSGNPVPMGTVTLTTGKYSSAAATLSGGNATISIPAGTLTTGSNILNVNYSGDSNYAPYSGSGLVTVGSVTVSVVPSASSISSTQPLAVTITVSSGSGNPVATGMVTLVCGSYISATTALSGGSATITIPAGSLAPGVDTLEVDYGDGNYGGASGYASVTVTAGPGFTITGTTVTIKAGATSGNTSTISVTPTGGFTGSVALTAAVTSSPNGAQSPPTLSFGSTTPVTITGTAPGTATLTITTTAPGGCIQAAYQTQRPISWSAAGGAALACLLFICIPARRRNWRTLSGVLVFLILVTGGLLASGCGGGGGQNCGPITPGTTPGTYTITVTGTSGATKDTGTVILTVD
jgi:Bacterial Ig-like domain (group 3)/Beta-propeller repeat